MVVDKKCSMLLLTFRVVAGYSLWQSVLVPQLWARGAKAHAVDLGLDPLPCSVSSEWASYLRAVVDHCCVMHANRPQASGLTALTKFLVDSMQLMSPYIGRSTSRGLNTKHLIFCFILVLVTLCTALNFQYKLKVLELIYFIICHRFRQTKMLRPSHLTANSY